VPLSLPPPGLWPHLLRAVLWPPLGVAALVATLVARRAELDPLLEYGLAALLLALALALVLDDPAAATLAASPTPLRRRRALRLAVALPLLAAGWAMVGWAAAPTGGGLFPPGWATLVLATFAGVVLASAAVAGRDGGLGGAAAGPALLAFAVAAALLPGRWALLPVDGRERRWQLLLALALVVLLAASADPAARRPWARRAGP
jgi:hypothetical protein